MKVKLFWQILIALGVATVFGLLSMKGLFIDPDPKTKVGPGVDQYLFGFSLIPAYKFVGDLFLNALKMIVVPLIAASIITSIAGMRNLKGLGRLGGKTIGFYLLTSMFAIVTGLAAVNLIKPGVVDGKPASETMQTLQSKNTEKLKETIQASDAGQIRDVLVNIVPSNVVKSASQNNQMLSLIVFCILFAVFMTKIKEKYLDIQLGFWQGLFEIMIAMTHFIMRFAPIGVFALVAGVIALLDPGEIDKLIRVVGSFFVTVLAALLFHAVVTLPLILKFVAGVNPFLHIKAMRDALVTAFSTSSSSATLPITLECIEEKAGVSKRTTSFVIPLGATVNMDGTALYECVAVMFLAQIAGVDLGIGMQFAVVLLALLTSIGVAGVPAASLVAIIIITKAVDPSGALLAFLGIILIVDRPLDMMRTSLNVYSDSVAAVTIAKTEGEKGILEQIPQEDPPLTKEEKA